MFALGTALSSVALMFGLVSHQADSLTKQVACMTDVVYYEAGEESPAGKLAVATVVLNRTESKHFPKTICGVVYQRGKRGCQFSWTCGHRWERDPDLYAQARVVALSAMFDSTRLSTIKKAVYFHNVDVRPRWMQRELVRTAKIGRHIFYAFPNRSKDGTDSTQATDTFARRIDRRTADHQAVSDINGVLAAH
jgi:spore germination cell wall hydrolase CwlJ-like protein